MVYYLKRDPLLCETDLQASFNYCQTHKDLRLYYRWTNGQISGANPQIS